MKQRTKVNVLERTNNNQCHHYWVIEIANGPKSRGTCKYCGEKKEFLNTFPLINPLKKNGNPLNLPRLHKVEMGKDSDS